MSGQLIILRHGESEWNARGVWTGTTDVPLTLKGHHDAELMGQQCRDLKVDVAFISEQIRTLETLQDVLKTMEQPDVPYQVAGALNERDYGVYTGLNKWQVKEQVGEEKFQQIRRGWDVAIPKGESLKQVYARSVPFYRQTIVPLLLDGQNVMLVAHGNSIRSLVKYLEAIDDLEIEKLEMVFGSVLIYKVDRSGRMIHKEVRSI